MGEFPDLGDGVSLADAIEALGTAGVGPKGKVQQHSAGGLPAA